MTPSAKIQSGTDQRLVDLIDQIADKMRRGEVVRLEACVREHPECADRLQELFPALQLMADLSVVHGDSSVSAASASPSAVVSSVPVTGVLGDFRIIREIGRGGMGVVYEAEQVSLGRKVALKVLPFAALLDTKLLQRFQNEARAAALLRHPNIVQIYSVGCERAVHFYAMDYIEGQTLAELIRDLRRLEGLEAKAPKNAGKAGLDLADSLASGRFAPPKAGADPDVLTAAYTREQTAGATAETARGPQAAISTERSTKSPAYFRSIAMLGVQVAEALEHAHEQGVIHRDVKPSNVILDHGGKPWVTDFGLARIETDATLTISGDLLGTVRYMSPEQALAKRIVVDHRTDVYSLGATLYELLTLQPVFSGQDRQELLRQIAFEEPTAPRRLNKAVSAELETIVLKAMAKNPAERYATAQQLADDLKRYLANEPILARRPSLADRAAKWARRHRPVVWAAAVLLVLATIGSTVSTLLIAQAYEEKNQQLAVTERAEQLAKQQEAAAKRQEELANEQRKLAEEQHRLADAQKEEAVHQRDAAEHGRYISDMRLAEHDRAAGQTERLFRLLNAQVPEPGRPDFRGWEWWYLFSERHSERFSFPFQIRPIAWSADGMYLATYESIGLVNIWDITNGVRKTSLKGCPGKINSISWSPDGKYLAAGNDRNTVVIWEIASGKRVQSLYGHTSAVTSIDWNPDGVRLASAGADGTIRIWDAHTAKVLTSLFVPSGLPIDVLPRVVWHPDGQQLMANYVGGTKIWDTTSGRETHSFSNGYVAFSPDGTRVVGGGDPQQVLDLKTGEIVRSRAPRKNSNTAWDPDGNRLAATTEAGPIVIWNAKTGDVVSSIVTDAEIWAAPAWSPKGRYLAASCESDRTVKIWDTGADPTLMTLPMATQYETTVAFSPDGKRLLAAIGYGMLKIVDVESGRETLSVQYDKDRDSVKQCAAWSPDGKRFALRVRLDNVIIADADTGKQLLPLSPCGDVVRSLAWSPDGEILAAGLFHQKFGGRVKLFSAGTGKEVATSAYDFPAPWSGYVQCRWRPDGKVLAMTGNSLRVWDSALRQQSEVKGTCDALDWSPDGKRLAVGTRNITIYDATTGGPKEVLRVLKGHTSTVETISWHPFMPRLASGSRDGTIRIWDTESGEEVWALLAGTALVHTVTWSPDGVRLAAIRNSGDALIWDASIADRFLKRHGDLRAKAWALAAPGVQDRDAKYPEAIELLERLRTLHPEDKDLPMQIERVRWRLASQLAQDGQLDEALALFQQLSAQSPDLPDYRLRLWPSLSVAGKERQAMLEQAVKDSPERPEYREVLAYVYQRRATQLCQSGKHEDAVPLLRKLAEGFPEWPDFRAQIIVDVVQANRARDAKETLKEMMATLEKIAGAAARWPDYRPELARRLERAGESAAAAVMYEQLVAEFPDAPEYRLGIGRHLIATARLEEAIGILEKLPADFPAVAEYRKELAKVCFARGDKPFHQGELENAFPDIERAIQYDPEYSEAYDHRGEIYLTRGDWDKAIADYDQAIRFGPAYPTSYLNRAMARARKGQWDQVFADMDEAIRREPTAAGLYASRGQLHFEKGDPEKAISELSVAVAMELDNPVFWYQRALMRLAAGRPEEYRSDCAKMLQRFGQIGKPDGAHWSAWTCALAPDAVGDFAQAVALAEKAAKGDPKAIQYANTWGAILYRGGRFEESVQRLTEADRLVQGATEKSPSSPTYTWFFLAMAHHRLGHTEEAKKWLDRAVQWTDKAMRQDAAKAGGPLPWNRRVTLKLLSEEAEALVKSPSGVAPAEAAPKEKGKAPGDLAKSEPARGQQPAAPEPGANKSPPRWLGYNLGDDPDGAVPEVADYTNFLLDGSWSKHGDRRILAARKAALKVLLSVSGRQDMERLNRDGFAIVKQNSDVVVAVVSVCPDYARIKPAELSAFAQNLKRDLPHVQYWLLLLDTAFGYEIPAEVDVLGVDSLNCVTAEDAQLKSNTLYPKWAAKAKNRRVVLFWDCDAATPGLVPKCAAGTLREFGRIVDQHQFQGLGFYCYDTGTSGGRKNVGLQTRPELVAEIKEIASGWKIGNAGTAAPSKASPKEKP